MTQCKVLHIVSIFIDQKPASRKTLQYGDYQIIPNVYDLTLLDFVTNDFANYINDNAGIHKESTVYNVLSKPSQVIRIHCQSPVNFKLFRRLCYQLMDYFQFLRPHVPIAAAYESQILAMFHPIVSLLKSASLSTHLPMMKLAQDQHPDKLILFNPGKFISMISKKEAKKASWQGITHADLNKFNIILAKRGPRIIDWPQNVGCMHLNAIQFLERALSYVFSFFAEKYKISILIEKAESLLRLPLEAV